MRTKTEIEDEIKRLKKLKPKVPRTTFFGDDNYAAIDAQIEALQHQDDSEEWMYDRWTEPESRERQNALDAWLWKTGESEERPSIGWEPLTKCAANKKRKEI